MSREIIRSGYESSLASGVVLTGGSALLDGVAEVAEQVLGLPVRLGVPQHVTALADLVASPLYAAGVGLVLAGAHGGRSGRVITMRDHGLFGRVRTRMTEWLRDFF